MKKDEISEKKTIRWLKLKQDFTCVLKKLYLPPGYWCQTCHPSYTEPKDLLQAQKLVLNALNLSEIRQNASFHKKKVRNCGYTIYKQTVALFYTSCLVLNNGDVINIICRYLVLNRPEGQLHDCLYQRHFPLTSGHCVKLRCCFSPSQGTFHLYTLSCNANSYVLVLTNQT